MKNATEKQINLLQKLGVQFKQDLTIKEASILIAKTLKEQRQNTTTTESKQTTKTINKIFTTEIFEEFKTKYYKKQFGYYNESNYNKSFKYILKIDDYYIHFSTPRIEKYFCFGHGQNGVSTAEQMQDAHDMAEYAATNESYFLKENLKELNAKIDELQKFINNQYANECVVIEHEYSNTNIVFYDTVIKLESQNKYINNYYCGHDITAQIIRELSQDEIQKIINALKEIKADFEKRLHTYLKKYGLSKLHTWTYLVD